MMIGWVLMKEKGEREREKERGKGKGDGSVDFLLEGCFICAKFDNLL